MSERLFASTPAEVFARRRARLADALPGVPVLLAAGLPRARNFPANPYPFRAESHFLYYVGRSLPGASLLIDGRRSTLFVPERDADEAVWHGPLPRLEDLERELGLPVCPRGALGARLGETGAATLAPNDEATAAYLTSVLHRPVVARAGSALAPGSADEKLADAVIAGRLVHDDGAVEQIRQAAAVTDRAHRAGMRATAPGLSERDVAAAMAFEITRAGMSDAYAPIVTVHGEVLHNDRHDGDLAPEALLLADVGAETREGWAADVTRTWPVSGRFAGPARALYEVVLEVQRAAIAEVRPGVRYRHVHEAAGRAVIEGLLSLGILRGAPADLFARGAHTLFFVHGIGHLLGLDVHDMEDLGDRAGYAPGRTRPGRFGDCFLRLDRDLRPGMIVTIEPGIYFIPALLDDAARTAPLRDALDLARLEPFAKLRGIRIEDDVLVTEEGCEILTRAIPKLPDEVELAMASSP